MSEYEASAFLPHLIIKVGLKSISFFLRKPGADREKREGDVEKQYQMFKARSSFFKL